MNGQNRQTFWNRVSRKIRELGGRGTGSEQTAPSYRRPGAPCPRCGRAQVPGMSVCPFCRFVLHPCLVWVRDDGSYASVTPSDMPYVYIGRHPDCHLVLPLDMVSRRHALVWYDHNSGRYYIRDEGSSNGTWVNGVPLYPGYPVELPLDGRVDIAGVAVLFLLTAGHSLPMPKRPEEFFAAKVEPEQLAYTGQTLGRYQILQVIGESLMSRVYKAAPIDNPHRIVVLKQPLIPTDKEVMRRFRSEVEVGLRLHHPNIVEIYEYSEDPPFLVMEYVQDSWSLEKMLDQRGRLPLPETVFLTGQVCDALDYAHGQGVVHRDIKPSNVLLAPGNRVKLCDFGIARAHFRPSITISGTKLGTPLYMAPEQARGDQVDHRCDLYALGVMTYEMLVGRPPFDGNGDPMMVIHQHIYEAPPPPTKFNPHISPDVERLLLQLLEKDPNRRPQSAKAVKYALESCLG